LKENYSFLANTQRGMPQGLIRSRASIIDFSKVEDRRFSSQYLEGHRRNIS
jgi:hypothetical protein